MLTRLLRYISAPGLLVVLFALSASVAGAQSATQTAAAITGRAPTGGRTLFSIDFAGAQVGDIPAGIEILTGNMDVVDYRGRRLLRASSMSAFLVDLPEVLPQDFLLEFELIPKPEAAAEDLGIEGTRAITQDDYSAYIQWHSTNVRAVGGGHSGYDVPMPGSVRVTLPGAFTKVAIEATGQRLRVYANGQLTHTLPNLKFARGTVLRVTLGGEDDDKHAVYLANMRIAAMGATATNTNALAAGNSTGGGGAGGPPTPVPNTSGTNPSTTGASAGPTNPQLQTPASTSTTPSVTPPAGANATLTSQFPVAVTAGNRGPVVTWQPVATATYYVVRRWKIDDLNCCNNNSGRTTGFISPWQDQPLSVSGTYVYQVSAFTPAGQLIGEAQYGFQGPVSTTSPTSSTMVTTTAPGGTITPMSAPAAQPPLPSNAGRYRVSLTGIRVSDVTNEPPGVGTDGKGDEVYAASPVVIYDRRTQTVKHRSSVKTKEYGEPVAPLLFPDRIQGGSMLPNGGIWTGNGVEQIPSAYDPRGNAIPALTSDRFPLLVWEGVLTDGTEALLLAPSVWERDHDKFVYNAWSSSWSNAALAPLFTTALTIQLTSPQLSVAPMNTPGSAIALPASELTAQLRDRPIGVVPQPPFGPPLGADYKDRYVVITREKLTALAAPGTSTTLAIDFTEPTTIVSRGSYTLYLRIERMP